MIVLVTGADGFVGQACCRRLVRSGMRVRAGMRSPSSRGLLDRAFRHDAVALGDLGTREDLTESLAGADAVLHLAARVHVMEPGVRAEEVFRRVNVDGTRYLATSAASVGVERFVYVSTVKVHGDTTAAGSFREDDRPEPRGPYARSKLEAERAVAEIGAREGMEIVIVRPPLVYGPRVRANFLRLMTAVHRGVPLPLKGTTNRRSMVFLENLAALLEECLTQRAAVGETFLVSDRESPTPEELVRRLAPALGVRPRLLPAPRAVMRLVGHVGDALRIVGRFPVGTPEISRLFEPLEVDASKATRVLGYVPPFDLDEGLGRTARWFLREHLG